MRLVLFTVGHSDRSWAEFAALLEAHGIRRLVDVRRFPRSRRVRWANQGLLRAYLKRRGILYAHLPKLGGRRSARRDSPNGAWRSPGFRGYADHMMTEEFERGFRRLEAYAAKRPTAVLCAEAVPWRCHRGLLADQWIARGGEAFDIMSRTNARPHRLPPFARVARGRLSYPGASTPPARARRPSRSGRRRPSRAGSSSRSAL